VQRQPVIEDVEDAHDQRHATEGLTGRQLGPAMKRWHSARTGRTMIDIFALAVSHGLIALALWRLVWRDDLDGEQPDA
jgi:hypothetical protein